MSYTISRSRVFHRLCRLTICIQIALPVMSGIIPAVHAASINDIRTTTYTLTQGESAASVAHKYHLTLDELKKLNQLRTFSHGFEHLQPGDELEVPAAPLTNALPQSPFSVDREKENHRDAHLAQLAAQTGQMLASGNSADAAGSLARGQATGMASSAAQAWLKRFGNARVTLGTDHNFNLADSSLELLTPYYDSKADLVYGQWNVHHADKRTQGNVGVGVRHFRASDMLGANLFADYDFSQGHTRAGVGVEYWRDNLKLAANGYKGLTGWKDSDLLHNYEEKVADGWDVRAEGYLPAYPALGAKLQYEQYYGDKVALFGHDSLQKNARALTAGVTWTPVPLLTLGVDQRTGREGKSETEFNLALNYRFGDRLSDLLDAAQVAERRSLAGSRYDMVDRNNNIVLKYRKKQVIKMSMASRIAGTSGSEAPLNVHVQAAHGLREIIWDQSELVNAGGALKGSGSQWSVVIPTTQPDGRNSWKLSGVAYDNEGNASERVYSEVVSTGGSAPGEVTETPSLGDAQIDANGSTTLTLELKDASGNPLTGQASHLTLQIAEKPARSRSQTAQPDYDSFTESRAGVYTTQVHANGSQGEFTLTPVLNGTPLDPVDLTIGDASAGEQVNVNATLDPATVMAGETSTLTVTLTDDQQAPVKVEASALSAVDDNGFATIGDFRKVESAPGTYSATVTVAATSAAGTTTLKVKLNDEEQATVRLTIEAEEISASALFLNNKTIDVNGATTLTVKLANAENKPVTGKASELTGVITANSRKGDAIPDIGEFTENSDEAGAYTATVTAGSASGTFTVGVKLHETTLDKTATLTVNPAEQEVGASTASLAKETIEASTGTTTLTVELKDSEGDALEVDPALLAMTASCSGICLAGKPTADAFTASSTKGTYTTTVTAGSSAKTFTLGIKLDGKAVELEAAPQLTVTAAESDE